MHGDDNAEGSNKVNADENRVNEVTAALVGTVTKRYALSADQIHQALRDYAVKLFDPDNKRIDKLTSSINFDKTRDEKERWHGWVEITTPKE